VTGQQVNSRLTRLPGAVLAPGSDNEGMLRAAGVTIRAAAVLYVGIRTFIAPWPGTAYGAAEIAVFAVTVILLALLRPPNGPGQPAAASTAGSPGQPG
jgi:hypothetical protein